MWDVRSGQQLAVRTQDSAPNAVAFGPDGEHLATANADRRVHVYVLDEAKLVSGARSRLFDPLLAACVDESPADPCPSGVR